MFYKLHSRARGGGTDDDMIKEKMRSRSSEKYAAALGYLPRGMREEICEIARSVDGIEDRISEIRVRADGPSTITVGAVGYPLFYRASHGEVADMLLSLSGGALYAHKDTLARGYISASGMRVGVSGHARYDGASVGIGEISSLVFRIGGAVCDFAERLCSELRMRGYPSLIVASPPMGGKTTALRALAAYIGSGRGAKRVVVVDERCEFDAAEYRTAFVDILRGYRRSEGIEQAYRTMAAEVIMIDEIATVSEAEALLAAHGAGALLIASVHAACPEDVYSRVCLEPLLSAGAFGAVAVIKREGRVYNYELSEIAR